MCGETASVVRKKDLVIILPLEYAKSVKGEKVFRGRGRKRLEIRFEVPGEGGETADFDLVILSLSEPDAWLNDLNQIIVK